MIAYQLASMICECVSAYLSSCELLQSVANTQNAHIHKRLQSCQVLRRVDCDMGREAELQSRWHARSLKTTCRGNRPVGVTKA